MQTKELESRIYRMGDFEGILEALEQLRLSVEAWGVFLMADRSHSPGDIRCLC